MAEKQSIAREVAVKVIVVVAASAALTLAGWLFGYWPTVKAWVHVFWEWLRQPHATDGWIIVVLGLASAVAAMRLLALLWAWLSSGEPTYQAYTCDEFWGMVWRWRYSGIDGQVLDLWCYCPDDQTSLVYEEVPPHYPVGGSTETRFHCETCGRSFKGNVGQLRDVKAKTLRQIDRKLRSGEWQKVVEGSRK